MILRRKFKVERHPEYDNLGLAPTWMSDGQTDPLRGMGVAHDILEHGSKDECEWQGLGGAVHVRGLSGYFPSRIGNPDPVDNIGAEFYQLFGLWDGQPIPDPGRTYQLRDEDAEEMIQAIVNNGCRATVAEAAYQDDQYERRAKVWTDREQRRRMVGWMRRGYRAAKARWSAHDRWTLSEAFKAIESAVDTLLDTGGEYGEVFEGMDVEICFDIEACRAWAHVEYEDY